MPRKRLPKGDRRRERVLDAAIEVLRAEGFERTSIRRIAERAGLSTSGVMHYFSTRTQLFLDVLAHRRPKRILELPEEDALAGMANAADWNARTPGLVQLFQTMAVLGAGASGEQRDYFVRHYAVTLGGLREEFERRVRDGRLREDVDLDTLARGLVALSDGLQLQWMYDDDLDIGAMYRTLSTLLLDAAGAQDASSTRPPEETTP